MTDRFFAPDEALNSRFFEAIGRCITIWSQIEFHLLTLLMNFIQTDRVGSVSAAFYSAVAFDQKLRMVDGAAQYALTGENLRDWERLAERCRRQSSARNQIAHYSVIYEPPPETELDELERTGIHSFAIRPRLAPAFFNAIARLKPNLPVYDTAALLERVEIFGALNADLANFSLIVSKLSPNPFPRPYP